ncbi:GILT-like protein 1 isoform X2 [Nilaparvata lugens]|uniref:GILT-like protein 1 isoform X2 n=1 Tax=Nilaparvata lugens TaxID=108931 RepID=UPI00193EA4AB|nr:GILT-like protein 1 isoform X2 [Nilaparvata lugens]XP_039286795.1 GILT-like protein 1 isoform X2 [Nilaparvata lugens]XP_039286796.1 GILT-like protein 1 isoform X2 [Nilaparvata lugens]XP_039286797.1 GILT-like protein 1 isoform X2 [Nilaparvata lugens]
MGTISLSFFVGVLSLLVCTATAQGGNVLKVTIFYESKCSDSMSFITEQLKPTFEKVGQYLKIDLVPYGNAEHKVSNGTYTFTCQHGPDECRYNKIHSCALKYITDQNQVVDFISCLMVLKNEDKVLNECAKKSNVDLAKINSCSSSHEGDALLAANGDRTHSFKPKVTWVPTIVFNDKYDDDDQQLAETNLLEAICKKLEPKPNECDMKISVIHI